MVSRRHSYHCPEVETPAMVAGPSSPRRVSQPSLPAGMLDVEIPICPPSPHTPTAGRKKRAKLPKDKRKKSRGPRGKMVDNTSSDGTDRTNKPPVRRNSRVDAGANQQRRNSRGNSIGSNGNSVGAGSRASRRRGNSIGSNGNSVGAGSRNSAGAISRNSAGAVSRSSRRSGASRQRNSKIQQVVIPADETDNNSVNESPMASPLSSPLASPTLQSPTKDSKKKRRGKKHRFNSEQFGVVIIEDCDSPKPGQQVATEEETEDSPRYPTPYDKSPSTKLTTSPYYDDKEEEEKQQSAQFTALTEPTTLLDDDDFTADTPQPQPRELRQPRSPGKLAKKKVVKENLVKTEEDTNKPEETKKRTKSKSKTRTRRPSRNTRKKEKEKEPEASKANAAWGTEPMGLQSFVAPELLELLMDTPPSDDKKEQTPGLKKSSSFGGTKKPSSMPIRQNSLGNLQNAKKTRDRPRRSSKRMESAGANGSANASWGAGPAKAPTRTTSPQQTGKQAAFSPELLNVYTSNKQEKSGLRRNMKSSGNESWRSDPKRDNDIPAVLVLSPENSHCTFNDSWTSRSDKPSSSVRRKKSITKKDMPGEETTVRRKKSITKKDIPGEETITKRTSSSGPRRRKSKAGENITDLLAKAPQPSTKANERKINELLLQKEPIGNKRPSFKKHESLRVVSPTQAERPTFKKHESMRITSPAQSPAQPQRKPLFQKPRSLRDITGKLEKPPSLRDIAGKLQRPPSLRSLTGNLEKPPSLRSLTGKLQKPPSLRSLTGKLQKPPSLRSLTGKSGYKDISNKTTESILTQTMNSPISLRKNSVTSGTHNASWGADPRCDSNKSPTLSPKLMSMLLDPSPKPSGNKKIATAQKNPSMRRIPSLSGIRNSPSISGIMKKLRVGRANNNNNAKNKIPNAPDL